jgi:hypothetical protein
MFQLTPYPIAIAMPLFNVVKQVVTFFQVVKNRTQAGNFFRNVSKGMGLKKPDRQMPPPAVQMRDFFTGMAQNRKNGRLGGKMDGWMTLRHQPILGKNARALPQVAVLNSSSEHCFTCATVSEISFT